MRQSRTVRLCSKRLCGRGYRLRFLFDRSRCSWTAERLPSTSRRTALCFRRSSRKGRQRDDVVGRQLSPSVSRRSTSSTHRPPPPPSSVDESTEPKIETRYDILMRTLSHLATTLDDEGTSMRTIGLTVYQRTVTSRRPRILRRLRKPR